MCIRGPTLAGVCPQNAQYCICCNAAGRTLKLKGSSGGMLSLHKYVYLRKTVAITKIYEFDCISINTTVCKLSNAWNGKSNAVETDNIYKAEIGASNFDRILTK